MTVRGTNGGSKRTGVVRNRAYDVGMIASFPGTSVIHDPRTHEAAPGGRS